MAEIMKKLFTINKAPYSVQCLLYADGYTTFYRAIIYCHGFGGHKETKAAMRFADYVIAGHKDVAVVCFDWPCHGEDVQQQIRAGQTSILQESACSLIYLAFYSIISLLF